MDVCKFIFILQFAAFSVAFYNADLNGETRLDKRRDDGYTDFSSEEVDAIVARHNYHRANTKPSAANMLEMKWDANLAFMAQSFVDKCFVGHGGTDGSDNISPYDWIGQNYASGPGGKYGYDDGVEVTDMWHSEEKDYFYSADSCSAVCGHYTQVVWAKTATVGCGRKECYGSFFLICNYGPGGNWFGEKPFIEGPTCSKCPSEAPGCTSDGLCTGGESDEGSSGGSNGGSDAESCEDSDDSCPEWVSWGECEANRDWMSDNCRKSCGVCKGCEDSDDDCAEWASTGECEKNSGWMLDNCKLSCNNC